METVLVTGGAGFIGSHLVDALLLEGYKVVVVDDLSTGTLDNLPLHEAGLTIYERSVTDREFIRELFREYSFNYIFHYAAIASVQMSIEEPVLAHQVNFDSTLYLLEEARKLPELKRFLFASSAAVYGDRPQLPCREDAAVNPISPYGVDKYASERYVVNASELYGVPGTVFRFFNVYGERQNPTSSYSGVLSIFFAAFRSSDRPILTIYGDGKQTRDFIYVKDVVKVNLLFMHEKRAIGEVLNVGTGRESSLLEVISVMEKIFCGKPEVIHRSKRKGDVNHSFADIEKIKRLGLKLAYTIETGLREIVGGR